MRHVHIPDSDRPALAGSRNRFPSGWAGALLNRLLGAPRVDPSDQFRQARIDIVEPVFLVKGQSKRICFVYDAGQNPMAHAFSMAWYGDPNDAEALRNPLVGSDIPTFAIDPGTPQAPRELAQSTWNFGFLEATAGFDNRLELYYGAITIHQGDPV